MHLESITYPEANIMICPWIDLPDPHDLSTNVQLCEASKNTVNRVIQHANSAHTVELGLMLDICSLHEPTDAAPMTWSSAEEKINDVFFHSSHCISHQPGLFLAKSVAKAYLSLKAELDYGSTTSECLEHQAYDALLTALSLLVDSEATPGNNFELTPHPRETQQSVVQISEHRVTGVNGVQPALVDHPSMRRWIRLHGAFFVITQALIIIVSRLLSHISNSSYEEIPDILKKAVTLLRGTQAVFVISTDFEPREFRTIVRPRMESQTYRGFSGTRQLDHTILLSIMKKMKSHSAILQNAFKNDHHRPRRNWD